MGKRVRSEGPASHLITKQGMVTMGGVLFIFVVFVLWLLVLIVLPPEQRDDYLPQTIVPIGTLIAVGVLGFIDDYVNVVYGFGIRGRQKLIWQTIVAFAAALYIQRHFAITGILVPLVGEWEIGPVLFVALAVFAIAGIICVAETVSVVLQVGSFKLRGKRIFRMSPLHNHFELIGWPEEKTTIRFWLIGALAGIVAAILAFATPQ